MKRHVLLGCVLVSLLHACSSDESNDEGAVGTEPSAGRAGEPEGAAGRATQSDSRAGAQSRATDAGHAGGATVRNAGAGGSARAGDGGAASAGASGAPLAGRVSDAGASGASGAGATAGVSGAGATAGVSGAGATAGVSGAGATAGASGGAEAAGSTAATGHAVTAGGKEIETVVLATRAGVGIGGAVTTELVPTLLFKDGSACRDIELVVSNQDAAAHKTAKPNTWTEWKLIDGKFALGSGTSFTTLYYQQPYPPLPSGFTLDGRFSRVTGGGTPLDAAGAIGTYAMTPDQHFVRSFSSSTSTTKPPDRKGTYEIIDYRITLSYDDGTSGVASFVFRESDPNLVLIQGGTFTRDK
jgi:hypothetical protein